MYRALLKFILAVLPLFGLFTAAPDCLAWDGICSCWPHDWHLVNCYTRCAWRRTWNASNALATPLSPYYVPRPPACCWNGGLFDRNGGCGSTVEAAYDATNEGNRENREIVMARELSPEAAAVYSPVQSERLGKVPNELDVVAPVGAPSPTRATAPAR
jgi:hypothetical protein